MAKIFTRRRVMKGGEGCFRVIILATICNSGGYAIWMKGEAFLYKRNAFSQGRKRF